jgi:hypothetical protein
MLFQSNFVVLFMPTYQDKCMNIFNFVEKENRPLLIMECFLEKNGDGLDGVMTTVFGLDSAKWDSCNSVKPQGMKLYQIDDDGSLEDGTWFVKIYFQMGKNKSDGYIKFYFKKNGNFIDYEVGDQ